MTPTSKVSLASVLLVLAFIGYVLCYGPFTHFSNSTGLKSPLSILPVSSAACMITMFAVTGLFGWWRYLRVTTKEGKTHPAVWSSLFSIPILLGTPMSYAIPNVSTLTMGLTMKSGSLATAPVADYWNKEPIKRSSWLALGLCGLALLFSCFGISFWYIGIFGGALCISYILGYLGRLRKMAGQKGSMDFFVVEHMLQPIFAFLVVCVAAFFVPDIRAGFHLFDRIDLWLIGIFSQGVGLFGGWMLLYKRESSFSMPLNRIGAVIANIGANLFVGYHIHWTHWVGVVLVGLAVIVLAYGDPNTEQEQSKEV